MGNTIAAAVLGTIAVGCYIISCFQLLGKGFLLNNAYLYASKKERETMDKKPYYRQSGTVFVLLGTLFVILAVDAALQTAWLYYCAMGIMSVTMVYAIVSSLRIAKKG